MITWIRHRMYRWFFDLGGPIMVRHRGHWLYVDPQGNVWRVQPTYRDDVPLTISLAVAR